MTPVPTTSRALRPSLWIEQGQVFTWDQTLLPFEREAICLSSSEDCACAIARMQVRGAPLIGAVAALGMAMAVREALAKYPEGYREAGWLDALAKALLASRPTAVNLAWAVNQVIRAVEVAASELHQQGSRLLADRAWQRAIAIVEEDRVCNAAIGIQTQKVLLEHAAGRDASKPFQILTHCNAGSLATVDWGTATAAIYQLHAQGFALHVWVDETRPRNQGASLTAYELADAGIPHTVIADNAGGLLMMKGWVDAVIVGCDRVCANGDVVNKIGTYLKALSAKAHGVPFWVACPESSIDMNCPSGMQVTIEERSSLELSQIRGRPLASGKGNGAADAGGGGDGGCAVGGGDEVGGGDDGQLRKPILVEIMQAGQACYNPGFDITPAALVSGLITEAAVLNPMRLREALA